MTRTARPVVGSIVATLALVVVIVACGSTATPAPVVPGGVATPPAANASNDPLGGLLGSLGLGSLGLGNLFHGAPELEAALPAQMCGAAAIKLSFGGAMFGAYAAQIPAFANEFIGVTGKTMADVSYATASSTASNCPDIDAYQVKGLDATSLQGFYTQLKTNDGNEPAPASVAGKSVIKTNDGRYAYFKGDIVYVVKASSDEEATIGLNLLP